MNVLGINSFFEHPSIAITKDNDLSFAIEEERITRLKGGKRYSPYAFSIPYKALFSALNYLNMNAEEIDMIGYTYNKWEHLQTSIVGCITRKRLSTLREEINAFINLSNISDALSGKYEIAVNMLERIPVNRLNKIKVKLLDHHLCHAASAFFCSGFSESLVLTADGSGEGHSTTIAIGKGRDLKIIKRFPIPHSLGFLYSFVTKYLGFEPFSDEYKVMGLASYGKLFYQKEFEKIISYDAKGNYKINKHFLTNLDKLFGPARKHNDAINDRHRDIAYSLQKNLENVLVGLIKHYMKVTGQKRLCYAGGVALNCVANSAISEEVGYDALFIQPAANDAGTALGACALLNAQYSKSDPQLKYTGMYLGTNYPLDSIKNSLISCRVSFKELPDEEMAPYLAKRLQDNQVIGVFRGRMEFGSRALGNRSILASPFEKNMQDKINDIKGREMFRPIAPIVLEEDFDKYFYGKKSEYMLFTNKVKQSVLKQIPAVIHVDNTARVQIVRRLNNGFLYNLLLEFKKLTGIPVLVNTSLNFKNQPIIESPADAVGQFYSSGLDALVLEKYLLEK